MSVYQMGGEPETKKRSTLRPPAPGGEESVSVPRLKAPGRPSSEPPPQAASGTRPRPEPPQTDGDPPPSVAMVLRSPTPRPPGPASERAADPRTDGRAHLAERAGGAGLDALSSAIPEPLPPDRLQRVHAVVRELAVCGPEADGPLRQQIRSFGLDALSAVAHAFPGSLWVDVSRPHRPLSTARHLSGLASALLEFGDDAVPYLPSLLRAARPEVRLSASLVARGVAHGDLVQPLAARLQDDVVLVRQYAMMALRACAELPEHRALRGELYTTFEDTTNKAQWRRKAAWMIGQLRDTEAVPRLIEHLGDREVGAAVRETLVLLVGRDVARFRWGWRSWHKAHAHDGRTSWLIESLDQPDPELRGQAVEELVLLTGQGFDRRHATATREQARELADFYRKWLADRLS